MRIDVKKFVFVGVDAEREAFFKKAQAFGIVHFIDTRSSVIENAHETQQYTDAIKILRGLPPVEQEEIEHFALADGIVRKILELNEMKKKLAEEERLLNLDISRVEVLGDFSLDDIRFIEEASNRKIQFFFAKNDLIQPTEEIFYVGSSHGLDYFMTINKEPKTYPKMVELHIDRSLGKLRKRLKNVHREIHEIETELKMMAKYNRFLHHALIVKLNLKNLHVAQDSVQPSLDGSLFVIEGWVPVDKLAKLQQLVDKLNVYAEEIAIDPKDSIPTYLENEGVARVGEDLVNIYDTPSHTDKDPSMWVLFFFALFFAFIVGDAGYGVAYLGAALYLRYKFPNATGVGKRLTKLILILSIFCILWGVITNSYFGISLDMNNPLRKLSLVQWLSEKKIAHHIRHQDQDYQAWVKKFPALKNVTDPHEFLEKGVSVHNGQVTHELFEDNARGILLELALVLGIFHLTLSLLRYIWRNPAGIGWLLIMYGGYLYAPTFLGGTVSMFYYLTDFNIQTGGIIGLQLIGIGLVTALFFLVLKHGWVGIFEIMVLLQLFSDVLSYLRLFALGLAGAIVGATINELVIGLPFVLAVILLFISHALNMVLGIMSGIIHGLRLNFLEWYHYSFEGGGKPYQPLQLMKIE